MSNPLGMRIIGGRAYFHGISFPTKGKAQKFASRFREPGYGSIVIKLKGKWGVYSTRTKTRKVKR